MKTPLLVTPGSERVRATIERDGLLADLEAIGATVLANACGPCIGQWQRDDVDADDVNVIVTSYNRNFPKRNDGSANTLCFVTSPETVMAFALAGTLDFDPRTDAIDGVQARGAGRRGAALGRASRAGDDGFHRAAGRRRRASRSSVDPDSDRLQLLEPFPAWDGNDFVELPVLLKAKGKCTTDHISAAGPWLKYRGHLENICGNLFLGAINAYTGDAGEGRSLRRRRRRSRSPTSPSTAAQAGIGWVAVGDENYGEGSSREHAAMEPRYRGAKAIIVRSFARIHETNLKKQGVLPLTFADPADLRRDPRGRHASRCSASPTSRPTCPCRCRLHHADGTTIDFACTHTMSDEHIEWFRAGGALNVIRARRVGN